MPWKIRIGKRSVINEYCHLDGRGGIIIGDDCSISIYSLIITASHKMHSDNFDYVKSSVDIRNRVWIGARAIVLDGSTIGEGAVIGAGSVFKGSAEELGIYVGNPTSKIGLRNISDDFKHVTHPSFF